MDVEPKDTESRLYFQKMFYKSRKMAIGLPWWLRGKNPPANVGDMGSIPGLGKSHMPWSN